MWDFSWLERRWPGGGYDDWGRVLDELVERGYDAVRIDAFPHLVAVDSDRRWTLKAWAEPWGAPGWVEVQVMPALTDFIARCARRGIKVALSTWFREDLNDVRMRLTNPSRMTAAWLATLRLIADAGLLDAVLYVDLCNEWPGPYWAPFLRPVQDWGAWPTDVAQAYINPVLDDVRRAYPELPVCFSSDRVDVDSYTLHDITRLDLIEHHIWVIKEADEALKHLVEQGARPGEPYDNQIARVGDASYRARPEYWQGLLTAKIARLAAVSRRTGKPLATTEAWAVVSYRDWPTADWGWIKALCAVGATAAAGSGRYLAIATSNFCGPQSVGMWRDVDWHRRLTGVIRNGPIDADLHRTKLYRRLA